jgi:hypothetical protein
MPDLNVDIDYFDHPKTKRLVRLLGKGSEVLPLKLWSFTAHYFEKDGRLTGISTQEIESECRWWGPEGEMVQAMLEAVFLERAADGTLIVHDWLEHQGHILAFHERAKKGAQARWAKLRGDASSSASSNAPTKPAKPTRPTKPTNPAARGRVGGLASEVKLPAAIDTPAFTAAWGEWLAYRAERKPKMTERTAKMQLKICEQMGTARAVAAIEHSIASTYQGIYEPRGHGTNGHPANKTPAERRREEQDRAIEEFRA